MARTSCITHRANDRIAVVHLDYWELMGKDTTAAALLGLFEYWANGAIALNPKLAEKPVIPVGAHSIAEIVEMLVGISGEKTIRQKLKILQDKSFISAKGSKADGAAKVYFLNRKNLLDDLGKFTDPPLGKNADPLGKFTNPTLVNLPTYLGKFTNASIYTVSTVLGSVEEPVQEPDLADPDPPPIATRSRDDPSRDRVNPDSSPTTGDAISPTKTILKPTDKTPMDISNPQQVAPVLEPPLSSDQRPEIIPTQENIRSHFWDLEKAPWRDGLMGFNREMVEAVHEIMSGLPGFTLPNGAVNKVAISKHLRRLESGARNNYGNEALKARQDLLDYWDHASQIIKRRETGSRFAVSSDPPPDKPSPPSSDVAKARRAARQILMGGVQHGS
jgi:hypothetical protein